MDIDQISVDHKRQLPVTERVLRMKAVYDLFELDAEVTEDGTGIEMRDLAEAEGPLAELLGELVHQRFK